MTVITHIHKIPQPKRTTWKSQKLAGDTHYDEAFYKDNSAAKYACIRTTDAKNKKVTQVISFGRDVAVDIIALLKTTFKI